MSAFLYYCYCNSKYEIVICKIIYFQVLFSSLYNENWIIIKRCIARVNRRGQNHQGMGKRRNTDVIGSDVPWLDCPACNALTWVIMVTE